MDKFFFHLVPAAAAAASRTAATAWRWLTSPVPVWPNPPIPDDRNAAGLGWAGDRRQFRPFERLERNKPPAT